MAKINLRPWRDELRARQQQTFVTFCIATALGAALAIGGQAWRMQEYIELQQQKNQLIQERTKELDEEIKAIKELRKRREELISRVRVIRELQNNRPAIVRIFDEMARAIPNNLHLVDMERKSTRLQISGIATSNKQVSEFMRNMDQSEWFKEPALLKVQQGKGKAVGNFFELRVQQEFPKSKRKSG